MRLGALRIRGDNRNYDVDLHRSHTVPVIIAGRVSTGKTSILQLIDYCLGAGSFPRHPEIVARGRAALLEIAAGLDTFVIERELGSSTHVVIHRSTLADMQLPHERLRRRLGTAGEPDSLSWYLLELLGLAGTTLREAPSRAGSDRQPLSFRDLQRLFYLPHTRLDNGDLLDESNFMRRLKLKQVIDIMFGVRDDREAELGSQLHALREQRRTLEGEIEALQRFLDDNEVTRPETVDIAGGRQALDDAERRLRSLDARVAASSQYLAELREGHHRAVEASRHAAAVLRDRATLLDRLLPLRAQYADDLAKLNFYEEASTLFDPLSVTRCPVCLNDIEPPPHVVEGRCSMCGQDVTSEEVAPIDVSVERRSLEERLKEATNYIEQVAHDRTIAVRDLAQREAEAREAQARLDSAARPAVSPFLTERDQLAQDLVRLHADQRDREQGVGLHRSLDDKRAQLRKLGESISSLAGELSSVRQAQVDRPAVIGRLSERYAEILEEWRFPKLAGAMLDESYAPQARGLSYREIGSSGATVLMSLAWQLAVFECAIEDGARHPGFLMIDSPQKNLGQRARPGDSEFADAAYGERIYQHLASWTTQHGNAGQIVVVDNTPPAETQDMIAVWFSRSPDEPPYGLIDDEIG